MEAESEIAELKAAGKVGQKKFVTKSVSQRTKKSSHSPRGSGSPRQRAVMTASPRSARADQPSPRQMSATRQSLNQPTNQVRLSARIIINFSKFHFTSNCECRLCVLWTELVCCRLDMESRLRLTMLTRLLSARLILHVQHSTI